MTLTIPDPIHRTLSPILCKISILTTMIEALEGHKVT